MKPKATKQLAAKLNAVKQANKLAGKSKKKPISTKPPKD